jgi:hypothetical protein
MGVCTLYDAEQWQYMEIKTPANAHIGTSGLAESPGPVHRLRRLLQVAKRLPFPEV